jgi:hypothetical protein
MARLRLRTQLLVATLLIIFALLGALLLVVRGIVRSAVAEGVQQSTDASLHSFEQVQMERDLQLARTAAMLAELPTLKAVLSTQHALTIQDASQPSGGSPEASFFCWPVRMERFSAFISPRLDGRQAWRKRT